MLIIGEHGDYPNNEFGQKKYPRYEFFKQVTDVFRRDGRAAPVFNDKHLSWKWEWAKEMVDLSRELKFRLSGRLVTAGHLADARRRHAARRRGRRVDVRGHRRARTATTSMRLEVIQCMAERRRGGETGVAAMQALRGDAVWRAMEAGRWASGGWDPRLFEACLCRSQRWPSRRRSAIAIRPSAQMREWVKDPVRLPLRIRRRDEGHDADHERPGRRFHVRGPAEGQGRAALDVVLPAAESRTSSTRPR